MIPPQELAAFHRRLGRLLRMINAREALSVKPLADRCRWCGGHPPGGVTE